MALPVGWYVVIKAADGKMYARPGLATKQDAVFIMRELFCDSLVHLGDQVTSVSLTADSAIIRYNEPTASGSKDPQVKSWTVGNKE